MIAVGTYAEAPVALAGFPGDVLATKPYRPAIHAALPLLGNGALGAHHHARSRPGRPGDPCRPAAGRRRGALVDEPPWHPCRLDAADARCPRAVRVARPQPAPPPRVGTRPRGAPVGRPVRCLRVAAVARHAGRTDRASRRIPRPRFRVRVGTQLWLGDPKAFVVRGHVLDVRHVSTGDRAGYRVKRSGPGGSSSSPAGPPTGSPWRRRAGPTRCGTGRSPWPRARWRPPDGSGRRSRWAATRHGSSSPPTCTSAWSRCPREAHHQRSVTRSTYGSATPRCGPTRSSSNNDETTVGHGPVSSRASRAAARPVLG